MLALISKFIKNYVNEVDIFLELPSIPNHIEILFKSKKGCRNFYRTLNRTNDHFDFKAKLKWDDQFNLILDRNIWQIIFNICFNTVHDNILIWFQYKVIMRILGTRKLLYLVKISNSSKCRLCGMEDETIIHLFVECSCSVTLWQSLKIWISNCLNLNFDFTPQQIILGYLFQDANFLPINTILIMTKYYIFTCAQMSHFPDIFLLQKKIKKVYIEEKLLSYTQDKYETFIKKWARFERLFQI